VSAVIDRRSEVGRVLALLADVPVVVLLGARQVGKTTLARQIGALHGGPVTSFDLEDPRDLARLTNPMLALSTLDGLVILDEVQRLPELFPVLRVLVDRPSNAARFLVLGSASPHLLRQGSESLAGRVAFHPLAGFALSEVGSESLRRLWLRGAFPRSFLSRDDASSLRWRREFVRTHLERDLPQLGIGLGADSLRRFWTMLAHVHGQVWNSSELARAFGVSDKTVRHYLDVLVSTFMVRRLAPWREKLGKRQVAAPKVYLTDPGLLHSLLGLVDERDLLGHPKVGASFEGFAIGEILRHVGAEPEEAFFWALHSGAELDLLVVRGRRRWGFEIKCTDAPTTTPSMRSAMENLRLDQIDVVHAGEHTYPLTAGIRAVALSRLHEDVGSL
jgi:predicted AAA+ superfamily ATPase